MRWSDEDDKGKINDKYISKLARCVRHHLYIVLFDVEMMVFLNKFLCKK